MSRKADRSNVHGGTRETQFSSDCAKNTLESIFTSYLLFSSFTAWHNNSPDDEESSFLMIDSSEVLLSSYSW